MSEIGRIQQMWKFKYKQLNIIYYQLNYYIMKKILFVALGATLLAAGCQKTEIINQVNPDGKMSMTFSTGISKLTKSATATGTENLESQGFVLTALSAYEDNNTQDIEFNDYYDELNNVKFTDTQEGKDANWVISTGESYFWPGKDRDLVFFAVSSAQTVTVGEGAQAKTTQKFKVPELPKEGETGFGISKEDGAIVVSNFEIKEYTVVPPSYVGEDDKPVASIVPGAEDDLMVADVVIRNQADESIEGVAGKVDLRFNHVLSKIEFAFKTDPETAEEYPVTVKSVVIEDVVTKATLGIGVKFENKTSVNTYDWSPSADPNDKVYYASKSTDEDVIDDFKVVTDLELLGEKDGDKVKVQTYATWLVIPQDITGKMVSITYTIGDVENSADAKEFTTVWPLTSEGLSAWNRNQYVKYTVTLSPHKITFAPTVGDDWNADNKDIPLQN